jgi:hypothetical protein
MLCFTPFVFWIKVVLKVILQTVQKIARKGAIIPQIKSVCFVKTNSSDHLRLA